MVTYKFPLRPAKSAVMPVSLVTSDHVAAKLIWQDGKSCDIEIKHVQSVATGIRGLVESLLVPNMGNTIISNGDNWYQIAYKQTSAKS